MHPYFYFNTSERDAHFADVTFSLCFNISRSLTATVAAVMIDWPCTAIVIHEGCGLEGGVCWRSGENRLT